MTKFTEQTPSPRLLGLSPILVFLSVYVLVSCILGDFYAMPLSLAFVITAAYSVVITSGLSIEQRISQFSRGAADSNILLMIWIFILVGAFAEGATHIGAVDATVQAIMYLLPNHLLLPGIFIASCLISLAIGTSVGTIVALVPIALGFAEALQMSPAFLAAVVAGGAFFGDNLSFISDTTIAATRTQEVRMKDKFSVNVRIALPAALLTLVIYAFQGSSVTDVVVNAPSNYLLIIPYFIVIVAALAGVNVCTVLILGIVSCGIIGAGAGDTDFWNWISALGKGINGMGELIIVTLLAGGVLELIRYNGGIAYLLHTLTGVVKGRVGGELIISLLVVVVNICTANNTIAILTSGGMAREISDRYGIDRRRTASLLDTFSCVAQGLLPYGAQLLLAAGFAKVSPVSIIAHLYYPVILGVVCIVAILVSYPKLKTLRK